MKVRIEKKVKGKYRVALKGMSATKWVTQALGITKNAKPVHVNMPLGSAGSSFIDGGLGKSGKAEYGGFNWDKAVVVLRGPRRLQSST